MKLTWVLRCILAGWRLQEEKPVALELDLSDMPVEDGYDGPMMEGEPLTVAICLPAKGKRAPTLAQ